eukprot:905571-Prorocentrum_lima.AAC.1
MVYHAQSSSGQYGSQVWVHTSFQQAVQQSFVVSARIMVVDIRLPMGLVRVVSAHAPTEEATASQYLDFLKLLRDLSAPNLHLLIGVDGNCRVSAATDSPL